MSEREFGCRIPESLVDGDWRGFWRGLVHMEGAEPAGEPELERHDPATVNGESLADEPLYIARGLVQT